jgi:deazaflavin-dependent oxidoreductase (nitroreductase family)
VTNHRRISRRQGIRNRLVILLNHVGLPIGPMHLLTVPGRKSGLPRTTPVAPVVVNGECYIIQAYPNSDWVKNARAAGRGLLTRGHHTRDVDLVEVAAEQRGTILREFPGQNTRGIGAFLRNGLVDSGSPDSFASAAASCPVFHAIPREASTRTQASRSSPPSR